MAPPYRVRAIGSSGCAPSTDATNGTKATPRKNPMLSQTSVRFTRTRKWNVWWCANQKTPRTTKLMTNVRKAGEPEDPEDDEADDERQEGRAQPDQLRREIGVAAVGQPQIQDEERHRDGEDAVRQREEATRRHPDRGARSRFHV